MKNATKILASFVLLAGLLGVTACGGTPSDSSASTGDGVTVKFWHTMGHTNATLVEKEVDVFQKAHPNITIQMTQIADYDGLESTILNGVSGNVLPTMAFCYPDNVAKYIDSDIAVKLDNLISDPTIGFQESDGSHTDSAGKVLYGKDDYVKAFYDEGTAYPVEGTYSLPFAKSTEALFYNKTEFDKNGWAVPTTWDEMWALCQQIRDQYPQKGDDGKYTYYPLGYDSDSNLYITLSQQLGIPYTSVSGDHYLFNNPQAKTMVTDLKSKYDTGLFVTKGSTGKGTYTSTKFTAGEIFMSIGSTGGTSYNQTNNFEVGVAIPPSIDANAPAVISQGPSICFFNRASTAELNAAFEFYRFISTTDNSNYYGISTGYQPVRISSFQSENYQSFMKKTGADKTLFTTVAAVAYTMNDSYFNSPVFVGSANARVEIGALVSSVLLGTKTVDKAFTDAMSNCLHG